ncbi:MoaF C-terminal domain-containing protein [Iodobacter sp. CM08]|uniref:MoaF C-terminal domain-containing protein n=1 Tax=Iodobacter sp. CM08 TaxID=3085902 RepID=UPI002981588D|nr:MoaF C-terminal domain-containing protein [Iodobacter sp. CM08]MDW5416644.1 MoaF C-terminal domain-containing protein [Iodobacter sp. CM08]
MTQIRPAGWKNYDDFAKGIATNRLPASDALVGRTLQLNLPDRCLTLRLLSSHELHWLEQLHQQPDQHSGTDWYEAIEVAADTYFIDMLQGARPQDALTIVVNLRSLRVLAIRCHVQAASEAGAEPRVQQTFMVGTLGSDPALASGMVPHESRNLIGLRTFQHYSPEHTYEHTYLNSLRYAWQCLVGVQRGHGDVDLASYYQFDDEQYIFTFREFIIPVASVFFFNFSSNRSTGKFLGVTGDGQIANNPAGAFIEKASVTMYSSEQQPL